MSWDFGKITLKNGGPKVKNYQKKNICSIVIIVDQYLDNIKTIIFPKFQNLVTSITDKVIDVSCKKIGREIIYRINKWWRRDNNVTILVCMTKVVFHSKRETYRHRREKTILINYS